MLLSKQNLLAVAITKRDNRVGALDNVHVTRRGVTVGCSGRSVLVVGPVLKKRKRGVPLPEKGTIGKDGLTISADTVRAVLKVLPRDTKYSGLLEHCNVARDKKDPEAVRVTVTDGSRTQRIEGKRYPLEFVAWRKLLRRVFKTRKESVRVVLNLDRLLTLMKTIQEVCGDSSAEVPVYIEFTDQNDVVLRARSRSTGQRAMAVMASYLGKEGTWLEMAKWERRVCGIRNNNTDDCGTTGRRSAVYDSAGDGDVQKKGNSKGRVLRKKGGR